MGEGKRGRRLEATDELRWEQLELLCLSEEQRYYERIRPLVLFEEPVSRRATETGVSERTLYRKIAAFREEGMRSLFSSPKAKRRVLPPAIRRKIVDLKAEHPPLKLEEIADICGTLFGRRPDGHTVKTVLEESAIPRKLVRRFEPYHEIPDDGERKLAVVALHKEGTYPLDGSTAVKYTLCMSKANRNNPVRSDSSESQYSLMEFMDQFPDDGACLEHLVGRLYPDGMYCPKCEKVTKHHREKNRPSYACQYCGHHEHPLVGTIFENSATSLRLWFYAIYLMSSTRCGISAKQLERELGVTYKTAWRMFHKIRSLLEQDELFYDGTVEVDEAYIGGKAKWRNRGVAQSRGRGTANKTPVLGMVQRGKDGAPGRVIAKMVPDASEWSLMPQVRTKVVPPSVVYTDEHGAYNRLSEVGYKHDRVQHSKKVYVSGDVHTNTIEGFWSHIKRGVSGVYRGVSSRHLQSYLDEYVFRYNNRTNPDGLFMAFLDRVEKASPPDAAS